MNAMLVKLVAGKKVSDKDLEEALYEVCDSVHSQCSNECPAYEANGGKAPGADKPFSVNQGCDCFKDGKAMLAFLRELGKKRKGGG